MPLFISDPFLKVCEISLVVTCSLATTLNAQSIYVSNESTGTIGEYGLDGSTINASLISGLNGPEGIAISGNDIFVANNGNGTIGEYTTSGATVDASLISGLNQPSAIVISGTNLFVASWLKSTVGEYTTSGATINASLITGLSNPNGIAISGNDLFVGNENGQKIGEYTTSGSTVNASLISVDYPMGIAISGSDLFVANSVFVSGSTFDYYISEYTTTSGATIRAPLITGGLDGGVGIAISGGDVFVANYKANTVAEYTTSGATFNAALISKLDGPWGIAIASPSPPSLTSISFNGSTFNLMGKNGVAGETYTLLESTNLVLPFPEWTPVQTNTLSTNGVFTVDILNGGNPAEFYILEVP